ncbi:MAG: DUF2891 domain-containing protein [Myxococcales bacterium]
MLDPVTASRFALLALACVRQEYPNKLDHVMNGPQEVLSPRTLHPAFYGCYDWHSCVHGYWMLARLLKTYPELPEAKKIRAALDEALTPEKIAVEVAYFGQPNRKSFERTYGWAWLLELAAEVRGTKWGDALQPLADTVVKSFMEFLPKQTYPIRTGVHPNTAFALGLALDYPDEKLHALVRERALAYFGKDRNAPLSWEPGGEDFLSPVLTEAALMAKVLPQKEFRRWYARFLPGPGPLELTPAIVSDRTDPKLVHLDGLNLSRADALYALSAALGDARLAKLADRHAEATLPHIESGSYEGEHWLATFAVHMLDSRAAR